MNDYEINYQKRKNKELFRELELHPDFTMESLQNYIPTYNHFFSLNDTNYNNINLNHPWYIFSIKDSLKEQNGFQCTLKKLDEEKTIEKSVFFKIAPLLDPFKFMMGKYTGYTNLLTLPSISNGESVMDKLKNANNSSYVDGFFSFLSSKLLSNGFVHGLDYYGSFLGIKNNFSVNVIDDLDYLVKSEYFNKHKNSLFTVEDYSHLMIDEDSDKPVKLAPITIQDDIFDLDKTIDTLDEEIFENLFEDIEKKNDTCSSYEDLTEGNMDEFNKICNLKANNNTTSLKSSSSCSSRTSYTSVTDEEEIEEIEEIEDLDNMEEEDFDGEKEKECSEDNSESGSQLEHTGSEHTGETDEVTSYSSDGSSDVEEEMLYASIPKFPVQLIAMEKCEYTFDHLITTSELSDNEWLSAFMQIIMILLTYQKVYSFTHNDLHTNNIMYVETDIKHLYYCYKKKYYSVPTYGRIFKIIDFGRSIYKYNNVLFCSDSFQQGGDAESQYNFEPYMNDKKPRLEPNYSFDLCRLACSIFDYLIDDMDDIHDLCKEHPYIKIVVDWCMDDNKINVLYKNNGAERYPDFKLYKMIARHVHNHTPTLQLERKEFTAYEINKKVIKNMNVVMNIDELIKNSKN